MMIDSMIAVLQAAKDGKKIQCRHVRLNSDWQDIPMPNWEFNCCEYRVKPEPKEYWLLFTQENGFVQAYLNQEYAKRTAEAYPGSSIVHVREVLE